jgi:hypothetical protein
MVEKYLGPGSKDHMTIYGAAQYTLVYFKK